MLGQVHVVDGLAHHGLRAFDVHGIATTSRRVPVARPLGEVVEVFSSGSLVDLELDQVGPVRRKDYVKQPGTVRADLTRGRRTGGRVG